MGGQVMFSLCGRAVVVVVLVADSVGLDDVGLVCPKAY